MTETELIQGCIQQDRRAQKELYDRYKTRMYTMVYRITNDFEQANDVLQEGFVEVFRGLKKFKMNSALGTWIHTIMFRKALKTVKGKIYFEEIDHAHEIEAIDWGPQIDLEHLEKAIQALPVGYRTVFTMIEIEGYKHKEVAQELGISENASKTQLYKAKRKLRESLSFMVA
jgi:RNA polymerase sigma-70 factor (ECF subfamily)